MSYGSGGGGSNPPWQRNSLGGTQFLQTQNSQMSLPNPNIFGYQDTTVYNQNIGMHQQGNLSYPCTSIDLVSSNMNQMNSKDMYNQTVSYSSSRGGFSQSNLNQNEDAILKNNSNNINCKKVGIVTKIENNCGFVDEEIFFFKNVCKGTLPKIGDQVLVEAFYNSTSPYEWHATSVQLVTNITDSDKIVGDYASSSLRRNKVEISQQIGSGYHAVPPPNAYAAGNSKFERSGQTNKNISSLRRSPNRHGRYHESRYRDNDDNDIEDRGRRQNEREKDRDVFKEKQEHSMDKVKRNSNRCTYPARHGVIRYKVQIPKITLNMLNADLLKLRQRYTQLYIPSDFFFTHIRWCDLFPLNEPFSLHKPCSFHIMRKNAESIFETNAELEPSDADHTFSAKVMLMEMPPISEVYRKCFPRAEEKDRVDDCELIHPSRLISFLVGTCGKNEPMAIGGPWSPSLDGSNPTADPSVLIRTAIRTCKALTGIDLSPCTQWYRFVELYYHRSETTHKDHIIPAHIETVVIYLPDIQSCVPTRDDLHSSDKQKMEDIIKSKSNISDSMGDGSKCKSAGNVAENTGKQKASQKVNSNKNSDNGGDRNIGTEPVTVDDSKKDGIDKNVTNSAVDNLNEKINNSNNNNRSCIADADDDGTIDKDDNTSIKREPTHHSELDPKIMKVSDLRDELEARNLSAKGLKPLLIARLTKVLKSEETEELNSGNDKESSNAIEQDEIDMTDIVFIDGTAEKSGIKRKDIPKPMDEYGRQLIENRYKLPELPKMIVHPSHTAKNGKFNCEVMSLSLLLDYRREDSKEHCFEVSLFAEFFNEMLMRDFAFKIYKAIYALPDKLKEKSVSEKEKEKDKNKAKEMDKDKENEAKKHKNEDDKSKEKKLKNDSQDANIDEIHIANKSIDNIECVHKNDTNSEKNDKVMKKYENYKDNEKDTKTSKSRKRKCHENETDDDDYDTHSLKSSCRKKEKEHSKYYTADPELLLSFVYFDLTHCGYIYEKDLENLFYTLGLDLSRAQIRKLFSKVITNDSLFYRKLTDKPNGNIKIENNDNDTVNNKQDNFNLNVQEMFEGNKMFLPIFKNDSALQINISTTYRRPHTDDDSSLSTAETFSGMVYYKGGFINVEKLLEQIKRSEKSREDIEKLLEDLRTNNAELLSNVTRSKETIKELQSDVKNYNRKLNEAVQTLNNNMKISTEYHSLLSHIHEKVASPAFIKSEKMSKNDVAVTKTKRERDKKD